MNSDKPMMNFPAANNVVINIYTDRQSTTSSMPSPFMKAMGSSGSPARAAITAAPLRIVPNVVNIDSNNPASDLPPLVQPNKLVKPEPVKPAKKEPVKGMKIWEKGGKASPAPAPVPVPVPAPIRARAPAPAPAPARAPAAPKPKPAPKAMQAKVPDDMDKEENVEEVKAENKPMPWNAPSRFSQMYNIVNMRNMEHQYVKEEAYIDGLGDVDGTWKREEIRFKGAGDVAGGRYTREMYSVQAKGRSC